MLLPAAVGIISIGHDFTRIFLGPKWMPMVPALIILSVAGVATAIVWTGRPVFMGGGRPQVVSSHAVRPGRNGPAVRLPAFVPLGNRRRRLCRAPERHLRPCGHLREHPAAVRDHVEGVGPHVPSPAGGVPADGRRPLGAQGADPSPAPRRASFGYTLDRVHDSGRGRRFMRSFSVLLQYVRAGLPAPEGALRSPEGLNGKAAFHLHHRPGLQCPRASGTMPGRTARILVCIL